jgi:hypothetical protein
MKQMLRCVLGLLGFLVFACDEPQYCEGVLTCDEDAAADLPTSREAGTVNTVDAGDKEDAESCHQSNATVPGVPPRPTPTETAATPGGPFLDSGDADASVSSDGLASEESETSSVESASSSNESDAGASEQTSWSEPDDGGRHPTAVDPSVSDATVDTMDSAQDSGASVTASPSAPGTDTSESDATNATECEACPQGYYCDDLEECQPMLVMLDPEPGVLDTPFEPSR